MNESQQLILDFDHRPALSGEDFLVSDCNRAAIDWIDSWPDWPAPALVIIGPHGSGKSHLAEVFAAKTQGQKILPDAYEAVAKSANHELIIEDVDTSLRAAHEEPLLHLYNAANESGHRILLTSMVPPARMDVKLPDLRSRLNAALTVEIGPPEDTLIAALLVKMFADRQVQVSNEVIVYTVSRMERSFFAARQIVEQADQLALAEKKRISVSLIKRVLEDIGGN